MYNLIDYFLNGNNQLLELEKTDKISLDVKKDFVDQFINKLVENKIIAQSTIDSVRENYPANSWSIDFPGWVGNFDEGKGKKFIIIGAEPHIYFEYLQTVYFFNNGNSANTFIEKHHPIFRFLSEVLAHKFQITKEEVLNDCYLTDLFPLSPFRGKGVSVGSVDKIQAVIGSESWINIRLAYAKINLLKEIDAVKPKLIITQGKEVLKEVINVLGITEKLSVIPVVPSSGKRQFIRKVEWNNISIISVPHIGSQRMRTFWKSNMEQIKKAVSEI